MPQIVRVRFRNSFGTNKTYHYICEFPVAEGDTVVVDSPNEGFTCVEVVGVHDYPDSKATKYVVQVVDTSDWEKRKAAAARKAQIEAELDLRLKAQESSLRYQALAAVDPAAARLVAELTLLAA